MTIFGVSGCMALLVTGFGLKDSNMGIVDRQFNNLWQYNAMVILNPDATEEEQALYNETVVDVEDRLNVHQEAVTFSKEGVNKQDALVYVPEEPEELDKYITLHNRETEELYSLSDDGVIMTEKLAELLEVSSGDTIEMTDESNHAYEVKVDAVVENYMKHYIYMSPSYYEEVFGTHPVYQTQLINYSDSTDEDELITELVNCSIVMNVTPTSTIKKASEDSVANMSLVMLVIVISAGCLAFVVLYNLNNINVSERIRELSTIKVLGFYHSEVTMYIVRENVFLTLLGVIVGSGLGKLLHTFIIYTSETDTMMMYPNISAVSYIFSACITIFFSMIVMVMMHMKLRKVNMIDALKSNE